MFKISLLISCFITLSCQSNPTVSADQYPKTKASPVVENHHGQKVKDPYRWLENEKDPAVKNWSRSQTQLSKSYLNSIPKRDEIHNRVKNILSSKEVSFTSLSACGDGFLAIKKQPPLKQPFLVYLKSTSDTKTARTLVDPNKMSTKGATTIEWFRPSPSGKYIAVVLSEAGHEIGNLYVYETATGKKLPDVVEKVEGPTAGGDMAWISDSEFLYTRYPRTGERSQKDSLFYQQVFKHKIGSSKDTYELGKNFDRISAIKFNRAPDYPLIIATVQYGDSGRFKYFLRLAHGKWKKMASETDEIVQAELGFKGNIFLISRKNAPKGKLLKLNVRSLNLKNAKTIVPQGKDSLVSSFYYGKFLLASKNHVATVYQMGGPSEIRIFDYNGTSVKQPKTLTISTIGRLTSSKNGDSLYYSNGSDTQPFFYYKYSPETNTTKKTQVGQFTNVDLSKVKVIREFATSKDGTKIPVNILLPPGYKKGEARPLLLTGYGGYGINISPRYRAHNAVWLEKGGIYAYANIRGGGEYGKSWHENGRLTKKQNVFDDFYAASRHLIKAGYTNKDKLGILGGSNGGLLMGAMITQHPGKFKAVNAMVGIFDSLRFENSPNGSFNVPEFGTVKKPEQFKALYAYSPYHNAKPKTKYPAILLTTGENDHRVDPMHSRKMAAILQKTNASKNPILLRVDLNTGHGQGTPLDMQIEQTTDRFAFFSHHLGL